MIGLGGGGEGARLGVGEAGVGGFGKGRRGREEEGM